MPFRLRNDARTWFRHIEAELTLDFDIYYLCLMAGLVARRKVAVSSSETTELVRDFPGDYRQRGRLIVAALLMVELEVLGIDMSEREAVNSAISHLVDSQDSAHMSPEGMAVMNEYSNGGYEVLTEVFGDQPRGLDTFLPLYKDKLDKLAAPLTGSD
jgi:hypothetical protein